MAFLEVMRDKGLHASQDNFADIFRNSKFMLRYANGQARQNLLAGVKPGLSGHPKYNPHADDIDFQIDGIRFVYVLKHTPWRNQIEIWFSILSRKREVIVKPVWIRLRTWLSAAFLYAVIRKKVVNTPLFVQFIISRKWSRFFTENKYVLIMEGWCLSPVRYGKWLNRLNITSSLAFSPLTKQLEHSEAF